MTKVVLEYPECFSFNNKDLYVPYQIADMFKGLFKTILRIHKCHLNDNDWELEINSFYHFIDVKFYRNPRKDCGQGTDEIRERNWIELKETLAKLFPDVKQERSWRWSSYPQYKGFTCDKHNIDGIRMFIQIGTVVDF